MAPFLHTHPYEPFLFKEATKLIVGTLPPPRFTIGDLKEGDVDFCYGSRDGQLWPILNEIFKLNLKFETTEEAAQQRIDFLRQRKIGICDIVASAERTKIDASDVGMENIQLRNLLGYLRKYPKVNTLLFTGGNSKNGPEYFFRRHLKEHGLQLRLLSNNVPRIHEFDLPITNALDAGSPKERQPLLNPITEVNIRRIKTVSLIAPSGAANRAVGSLKAYKEMKKQHPKLNTIDFRVLQYKAFF